MGRSKRSTAADPLVGASVAWRGQHGALLPYAAVEEAGDLAWTAEDPLLLDGYLRSNRISDIQHGAGERFRELWLAAGREPPSSLDYTPLRGRAVEMSDAAAAADRRCRDAERAVPGPSLLAVTALCCWDQHAPLTLLRTGLSALARHFRFGGA